MPTENVPEPNNCVSFRRSPSLPSDSPPIRGSKFLNSLRAGGKPLGNDGDRRTLTLMASSSRKKVFGVICFFTIAGEKRGDGSRLYPDEEMIATILCKIYKN